MSSAWTCLGLTRNFLKSFLSNNMIICWDYFQEKNVHPSRHDPRPREKINYFHTCSRYIKRFYEGFEGFKAFIKPFETPQRNAKIKIYFSFYFNTTFWNAWGGKFYEPTLNINKDNLDSKKELVKYDHYIYSKLTIKTLEQSVIYIRS